MGGQPPILTSRRASLLLAISLLTSTATASAGCAWVLWVQVSEEPWLLLNTAPDYATCKHLQPESVKHTTIPRPQHVEVETSESGANVFVTKTARTDDGRSVTQTFNYLCAPTPWTLAGRRRSERHEDAEGCARSAGTPIHRSVLPWL